VYRELAVGGLGMRVVGGKLGPDKKLGTYVSTVVRGGVADMAGIIEGQFCIYFCCKKLSECVEFNVPLDI